MKVSKLHRTDPAPNLATAYILNINFEGTLTSKTTEREPEK